MNGKVRGNKKQRYCNSEFIGWCISFHLWLLSLLFVFICMISLLSIKWNGQTFLWHRITGKPDFAPLLTLLHINKIKRRKAGTSGRFITHLLERITSKNSKWVWSGNTTITNHRQPHGTARKCIAKTCYMQNYNILACFCSQACWCVSNLFKNFLSSMPILYMS